MSWEDIQPLGIIRTTIAIGALLLLTSVFFTIWTIRHAPHQKQFNYLQGQNAETVVWQPLEIEKQLYRDAGYMIDWLDSLPFQKLRSAMGPYSIIFELLALRFYGLGTIFPLVFFTALFGLCEGRIRYHEKLATFGNLSSTRFKVFTLMAVFCFALCFIFLTLPFGSELPFVGTIPLTVNMGGLNLWVTAPYLWAVIFAVLTFSVAQQITGNLAREI